ncbi:hypothetical protein HOC13_01695 [Candidatus Woesearchaeota archaeon]|nr:hypothetical protein [Candidatus Woesearchaeota archaeon]
MKYTNKLMAILMLTIFLISLAPLALAEDSEDQLPTKPLPKTKELKKVVENTKEKLIKTREQYQQLKERHEQAKEKFAEQKERIIQFGEKIKDCKEDTEQCKGLKSELKVGVKTHLLRTADVILKSLEKLEDRIENSENLSEEEKQEALSKLAEDKAELEAKIAEVEALSEDASAEELREAIKELKDLWQNLKQSQQFYITQLTNHKMENLVGKHRDILVAMDNRIATIEEQGVENLEELKAIREEFSESVNKLEEDFADSEEAWKNAKDSPSRESVEAAHQAQKLVREDLKETKDLLREFVQEFNVKYQEIKSDEIPAEVNEDEENN